MAARRHPAFGQALAAADLCTPDGVGVLWAARLSGVPLDERVTGSDAIYRLCERGRAARVADLLPRRRPRRGGARGRGTGPPLSRPARRRHIRRLARRGRLAADPATTGRGASRFAVRGLRPSPPGHLDSTTQRGVAGRGRAGRRRRLRLRRRHHPPAPRSCCAGWAWSGYTGWSAKPWRWRRMTTLPLFALLVLVEWARRRLGRE